MQYQPSEYKHIIFDCNGIAVIDGSTMKVRELVLEHLAYGWTAEQLQREHPYLNLAQIYAALAYYFDNQSQIDVDIAEELRRVEEASADWQLRNAAICEKLRDVRRNS